MNLGTIIFAIAAISPNVATQADSQMRISQVPLKALPNCRNGTSSSDDEALAKTNTGVVRIVLPKNLALSKVQRSVKFKKSHFDESDSDYSGSGWGSPSNGSEPYHVSLRDIFGADNTGLILVRVILQNDNTKPSFVLNGIFLSPASGSQKLVCGILPVRHPGNGHVSSVARFLIDLTQRPATDPSGARDILFNIVLTPEGSQGDTPIVIDPKVHDTGVN